MIILLIKKYLCGFIFATIIKGFSTKIGIFEIVKGFFFINFLSTIIVNILITYIATFLFWEIFRIFENHKITKYCEIFPKLIKLHKNSIIPPGFMLHWKFFGIRTLYALLLTGFAEGSFLLAQYMSPFFTDNFIILFTNIYYIMDIYLFFYYDWMISFNNFYYVSNEEYLAPPLPLDEIKRFAEEEVKLNNSFLEQKKTMIRGFFSIHTAIIIGGLATCEVLYIFFFK